MYKIDYKANADNIDLVDKVNSYFSLLNTKLRLILLKTYELPDKYIITPVINSIEPPLENDFGFSYPNAYKNLEGRIEYFRGILNKDQNSIDKGYKKMRMYNPHFKSPEELTKA